MQARKGKEGAISLYLALMLAVMIPLTLTMIEGARLNAIELTLECAMDLAADSVLAEYSYPLMKRYDLLLIDTAYEHERGSLDHLKEHLEKYLDYNIHPDKELFLPGFRDFTGLSLDRLEVVGASRATDEKGKVFRYLALSYMLEKYGIAYAQDAADLITLSEQVDMDGDDISSELSDAQGDVDGIEVEEPDDYEGRIDEDGNEEEWQEPEKDDPAGNVQHLMSKGILALVCDGEISGSSVNLSACTGSRSLVAGEGMIPDWEEHNSLMEQLLFNEYILEKCGNYQKPLEGSCLQYETEYVIAGKAEDRENLKAVANRLLVMQGAVNTALLFSDGSKKAEARAMAEALSFVILFPEVAPLFEALIEMAWIAAESIYDVRILFDGGKVPILKKQEDWHLSLENALDLAMGDLESADGDDRGEDYTDHLRLFLYLTSMEDRTLRCMDMVEADIRKISGYEEFRLDDCVAAATVQYIFKSNRGYTFLATRKFRYM